MLDPSKVPTAAAAAAARGLADFLELRLNSRRGVKPASQIRFKRFDDKRQKKSNYYGDKDRLYSCVQCLHKKNSTSHSHSYLSLLSTVVSVSFIARTKKVSLPLAFIFLWLIFLFRLNTIISYER